ncbi:MAG: GGDEF domain-containing protein [Leptothrix sp. (in: Bacteria)]|nr:GGDEF domain-containing protein [Leptothrix sp. (in: b-proteobacteria)]
MAGFWRRHQDFDGAADSYDTMGILVLRGSGMRWRRPVWARACLMAAWLALATAPGTAAVAAPADAATPMVADDREAVPAWPAVRVLLDAGGEMTAEQLAAQPHRFDVPQGTAGNLGRQPGAVWLRLTVRVPGAEPVLRVLDIDYPALNQVDLYTLREGRLQSVARMGNQLPLNERPLRARGHAAELLLAPGDTELLLRVQTKSSMVLPITLRTPAGYTSHESASQLLLGAIFGLGLCMLVYSLMHWVSLRDSVFLDYAALVGGNVLFTLTWFGLSGQYLWPDAPYWSLQASPLAVLVAVAAGARFMRATLATRELGRIADLALQGIGVLAALGFTLGLPGWLPYAFLQSLTIVLGLGVGVLVLPVAYLRVRRGERAAVYILCGWAIYLAGALTTAALLRGHLEPGFWALYLYPISTMVEMSAWMAVLGLRVQVIHRSADRARVETETLRVLAQTDALTGLPNRRGLHQHLVAALTRATPQQLLAVYLLDLDGFKPVNDRYGHDVGDALLAAVGQRLQAQLRGGDVVARLGGDEFVVLATGLADEAAAQRVGQKLLAAFEAPFDAAGQRCSVGLTGGYALAPLDSSMADELLKRADAAMYAGKQAGRQRVQRGGRSMAAA